MSPLCERKPLFQAYSSSTDIGIILTQYALFYGYVCKSVSSTDDFVVPTALELEYTNADIL
jgi:hypothetical protein